MTKTEQKKFEQKQKRFMLTALSVLSINGKVTYKEYTKIRDRILENKEVTTWLMQRKYLKMKQV